MTRDHGELADIRRELRRYRMYLEDDDMRGAVGEWIEQSYVQSDADTARQYVEERLNGLLDGYPMYNAPSVARGAEAFPDECEGCPHYGAACPVVTDSRETDWRERKLKDADTEREARRVYEEQARDVDCQRIPEFLDSWDNDHKELLQRGQQLQSRVEDHVHATADEDVDDGGPEDDSDATVLADGGDAA